MILVLDPDERSRDVMRRLGEDVEPLETAAELRARGGLPPTLVVLEVDLPDASGYEICQELHERHGADLPVIFVAEHRTEATDRVAGLLVGADDYLVKPVDPDELLARVRRSLRRRQPTVGAQTAATTGADLTRRERQILSLLASGRTQKEIGKDLVISPKTVGTHIQHILAKLGVHSRAHAVVLALRAGIVDDLQRPTEEHEIVSSADAA